MKKFVLVLVIVLVVLGAGVYLGANLLLDNVSRQALDYFMANGKNLGLQMDDLSFGGVRLVAYNGAEWTDVTARISFLKEGAPDPKRAYLVRIGKMRADVDPSGKALSLSGEKIDITPIRETQEVVAGSSFDRSQDSLEGESFKVTFDANIFDPGAAAKQMSQTGREFLEMLKTGEGTLPVQFSGNSKFMIDKVLVEAKVRMEYKDGRYMLVMDKEDIRKISGVVMNDPLTNAEIEIMSEHPLQTPQLLRVKEQAKNAARLAAEKDAGVPEDAYRCTYWSYLLTRDFGEKMAEKVTLAHEYAMEGTEPQRGPEHEMDYNNYEMGRRYATAGYEESSILDRVKTDPLIIRSWDKPVAVLVDTTVSPDAPVPVEKMEQLTASVSTPEGAIVPGEAAAPVAAQAETLPVSATVSPEVANSDTPGASQE